MSFLRAPLWQQLAIVWTVAIALVVGLLGLDREEPTNFFWFIPYPRDIADLMQFVGTAFRARPLFVSAVLLIPSLAILSTIALTVAQLARAVGVVLQNGAQGGYEGPRRASDESS